MALEFGLALRTIANVSPLFGSTYASELIAGHAANQKNLLAHRTLEWRSFIPYSEAEKYRLAATTGIASELAEIMGYSFWWAVNDSVSALTDGF